MVSCSTDIGFPLCPKQLHGNNASIFRCDGGDWQVWAYLQISSLSYSLMVSSPTDMPLTPYPLESSLLSTYATSSLSSDENAQSFTLRAPSKLKATTQVVALNCFC
ncbi:hypothetical protein N665_0489s0015 [Sinapis alba]|nr:hypothetical protein N665_0489s0015 [Sinapis alba]